MTRKEALKQIKTKRVDIPIYRQRSYIHFGVTAEVINYAFDFNKVDFAGVVWVDEDEHLHVAFSEEHMDIPTIAHEAVHMTNRLFSMVGAKLDSDNDEPQAYMVTFFVEAILEAQHKLGVGKMKQQG